MYDVKKYFLLLLFSSVFLVVGCAEARETEVEINKVEYGNSRMDVYLDYLRGKRVGLVVNQASVVDSVHLCDTLLASGIDVKRIFAPEHGFRGVADAGEAVADGKDARSGLEIVSLYGKNKKPTQEQMNGLDVVVYDLQDVGVRFYTYISTMHYMMEACAESGVPLLILDRPNPNGDYVDGPVLESDCKSFVGMHPIPIVYGLTCGELAYMINEEGWLSDNKRCDIKVVEMLHYYPSDRHELPIAPSPNLKDYTAVRLYPSLCFFEGANVSVGRGTQIPFKIYGSPYMKQGDYEFVPEPVEGAKSPLFKGRKCKGYDLSAEDSVKSIRLEYLMSAYEDIGDSLFWANGRFFDLLAGTKSLRRQMKQGATEQQIRASWQQGIDDYKQKMSKYRLYVEEPKHESHTINWKEATRSAWVDSLVNVMTLEEKIAQLIWVTVCHTSNANEVKAARENIVKYGVGGVLMLQGSAIDVSRLTMEFDSLSRLPLLFSADAENGLSMKFDDVTDFPKSMTLGAIRDVSYVEAMGSKVGEQLRACGIQVNFAPVADVNTNPNNPIIGMRSYGENARRVSEATKAYVAGLQSQGCVAVVKHFPGHGDTSQDSHTALPIVTATKARLDSVELLPFRESIEAGAMGIMCAHLNVPALDKSVSSSSMSSAILSDLLRGEMGFEGLIVSDAVNMAGVKIAANGKNVEAECLMGGNDVVEFVLDVPSVIEAVKERIAAGKMTEQDVEQRLRRVLAVKEWCKNNYRRMTAVERGLRGLDKETFADKLFMESVTLLEESNVAERDVEVRTFGKWPQREWKTPVGENAVKWLLVDDKSIAAYNSYVSTLPKGEKVVVLYVGNPYRVKRLKLMEDSGLVIMYESTLRAKRVAYSYLEQRFEARGVLPVSIGKYKEGHNNKK